MDANVLKFRDEIIEFQKQRADLIKWKLISIGAVGSIVFATNSGASTSWLISLLPLVAAYIDLSTRQIDIRIALIATYLKSIDGNIFSGYENFLRSTEICNMSPWVLGNSALLISSLIVTLFVISFGVAQNEKIIVYWGAVGVVLAIAVEIKYRITQSRLDIIDLSNNTFINKNN